MAHTLRYIWGLVISTLALPFVLLYGILLLIQELILITILIPFYLGLIVQKFVLLMHTLGPTAHPNEDLTSPLTRFNKFILSKEIHL